MLDVRRADRFSEDPIRIFVGSDVRMRRAEEVLEYSVRKNTSAAVSFTWMRAGEGVWSGWRSQPALPYSGGTWATHFSGFRCCVPELANRQGRAIYLDADMLVLGDVAELYDFGAEGYWHSVGGMTEVSVIDCGVDYGIPPMASLRHLRWRLADMLPRERHRPRIPSNWNHLDTVAADSKLIHFTDMRTQPWRPWPEAFEYEAVEHRAPQAVSLWFEYERESQVERGEG